MRTYPIARRRHRAASLALVSALVLAACHPSTGASSDQAMIANPPSLPATLPLAAGAATRASFAPGADRLPAAAPLGLVRVANPSDAYAYADDAWDFGDAVFDAPPDYGFDYNGVEPWAWEGYDRSTTFVEPIDGGYRYYYYRPGADQPYFVRDPDYGYGYDGGQLAVIYAANGAIIPYADYGPRADYAARYRARGRALYEASHARQRRAVVAANWAARSAAISAAQSRLAANRAQQDGWRTYHARTATQETGHWQPERTRRQADAARFADWRQGGFRAAPPPRVIPANWQQAKWARDDHRYVAAPAQKVRPADRAQHDAQAQAERQVQAAQHDAQRQQQAALAAGRQQQIEAQRAQQGPRGAMQRRQDPRAPKPQDMRVEPQGAHQRAQPDPARAQAEAKRQTDRAAQGAAQAQQRAAAQQQRTNARAQARTSAQAEARDARAAAQQQQRQQAQVVQGQARAQAQAARQQAQGQARQQAEAARGAQRAQQQAAHAQQRAARPAPAPAQPRPQPQPQPQHSAPPPGGGGHGNGGGHDRKKG